MPLRLSLNLLIVTIFITIFVGLVVLTVVNVRHDYSGALKSAAIRTGHQARTFSEHAARSFEAVDLIMLRVVEQIERDKASVPRQPEAVQAGLHENVNLTPQIYALVLTNAQGTEVATNLGQGIKLDLHNQRYFKIHSVVPDLGMIIGDPIRGRATNGWFLPVSRRINEADGKFGGVVVAMVSGKYFRDVYQTIEDAETFSTAFLTSDGMIFASSSGIVSGIPKAKGLAVLDDPFFRERLKEKARGTYFGKIIEGGADRIVSFQKFPKLPLFIVTSIIRDNAFVDLRAHMKTIAIIIAVTGLVLCFLLVITVRQVIYRERTEQKWLHMANHDLLTNLPNRRQGMEYLSRALATRRRRESMVAVLFADLDGFKEVNDKYGHEAGDQVLVESSERFLRCVRETDVVSRLGGDEFLIILNDINETSDAYRVAELILDAISRPFRIDGRDVILGTSIGVAISPLHGDKADTLIKKADYAMYEAKEKGKNNFMIAA